MPRTRRCLGALVLTALPLAVCSRGPDIVGPPLSVPMVRFGPDRGRVAGAEREPAAKAALLSRINAERRAAGVPPLKYDLFAARVGDAFCLDAAVTGVSGHWDLAGRAPYLRWALAGGVDYHAENACSYSRIGGGFREDEASSLLLQAHGRMMAERPPDDGHRQTVLDPLWTHVGIGFAAAGGEVRMTEEYSRRLAEWVEMPASPLPPGSVAPFAMRLPAGWNVGVIEVAFERFPKPLTAAETRRRGSYGYPPFVRRLVPRLEPGFTYAGGRKGDFDVVSGVVRAGIPLSRGPGHYFVLAFAGPGEASGRRLSPITGALITAAP